MSEMADLNLPAIDASHHLHPFTDNKELHDTGVRLIERAEGVYLWDHTGKQYIDSMAGLWCVNVGYDRQELIDAASQQMSAVPYYNTFFGTSTPVTTKLAQKIASKTPDGLNHVFFTNSGSEANDTIIKAVRFYWNLMGKPSKKKIIAREYAYHGVTLATASLSGLEDMHPQSDLPLPGMVERVVAPYWYQHGGDLSEEDFGLRAAQAIEEKILEVGADNIGAFIGEPIYGAGGVMVPPSSYWPEVNRICKKYDVLLIADEVICGFGRTGNWFGSQTFGIEPDIMAIAKGLSSGYLPVAGAVFHDRIAEKIVQEGGEWVHGFTYSGHPTSCAVALKNIEILEDENLVERVRDDIGPYFQNALKGLLDHPLVGEVRGRGLIGAIELVKDKDRRESYGPSLRVAAYCRDTCLANGLVIRAARDCLMTAPPFIITREQVDEMMRIIRLSLDQTLEYIGA